jgi:hypothetical protein
MARFIYHSRLPGNLVAMIGAGAVIAFVVLVGLVKTLHHPPAWLCVFFSVFIGAVVLALGVSRFVDLLDGRGMKYCEADDVVEPVAEHLRLAIEGSRELSHPLADAAIR